jgi:molybdopterin synthase catalytic subunit
MIELTYEPLNPEKVTSNIRRDSNGAVVTFLGTTRNNFQGKQVLTLEYEAYEEMALKKLGEVREELQAEFELEDIAISHRIGTVPIGEISLVVAVASPHRKLAFEACQKAVDRIKEVVPIWKKEVYEEGSRWVACEDHEFEETGESATAHTHSD